MPFTRFRIDTHSITVPVGDATKGHVFNALGDCLDQPGYGEDAPHWSIHRHAPRFDPRQAAQLLRNARRRHYRSIARGLQLNAENLLLGAYSRKDRADVNGDGRNDVITSYDAHGYGLGWFEQNADRV